MDADGCLTIRPKGGADFGALPDSFDSAVAPWCDDGCRQDIKSVYVSKGVKASRYSRGLFAQLSSAESMDVSNLDVSSAIDLGCMFELCSSLTSLNVSGWDTSSAKNMEAMFYGCSSLASLDISSFVASESTKTTSIFEACSNLGQISVGDGFDLCAVALEPSQIEGWTGNWVDQSGNIFSLVDIPSGKKGVYSAEVTSGAGSSSELGDSSLRDLSEADEASVEDSVLVNGMATPAVTVSFGGNSLVQGV
ncbi:BspA family leucine-rich repeat surface protein, partial [Slackia isoflavoniconvertens]|uniref:BspA family leucine-rich repeat surface protein n=1 Tax=Slackia isoflavoniconvertens TaxID=572010 RepID=UPI003AB94D4C